MSEGIKLCRDCKFYKGEICKRTGELASCERSPFFALNDDPIYEKCNKHGEFFEKKMALRKRIKSWLR